MTELTNIPKYVSGKIAKEILGVNSNTLRRWADTDKIHFIRSSEKGKRLYDIRSFCGYKETEKNESITYVTNASNKKRTYCYCRVSTRAQADDLQRQVSKLRGEYPNAVIIQDIGSGINWKRKGLLTLIQEVKEQKVERVVVEYRDRLCRFAFELLEHIFEIYQTPIVVLNKRNEVNGELAEDIISIIHVYSCKSMGKRRYKKRENDEMEKEIGK